MKSFELESYFEKGIGYFWKNKDYVKTRFSGSHCYKPDFGRVRNLWVVLDSPHRLYGSANDLGWYVNDKFLYKFKKDMK